MHVEAGSPKPISDWGKTSGHQWVKRGGGRDPSASRDHELLYQSYLLCTSLPRCDGNSYNIQKLQEDKYTQGNHHPPLLISAAVTLWAEGESFGIITAWSRARVTDLAPRQAFTFPLILSITTF